LVVGKPDGMEVGTADSAAWEEAMSRFGNIPPPAPAPKKANPLASLSLHARRLLPPEQERRDTPA